MKITLKKIIINNTIVVMVCVAILFITSWAPFMTDSALGTKTLRNVLNYAQYPLVLLGLLSARKLKGFSTFELTAMLSVVIYRAYNIIYAYDYKGLGITGVMVGVFICLMSEDNRALVFKCFKYLMVIVSVYGIICYISYYLHLGLPYKIVYQNSTRYWLDYGLCYFVPSGAAIRYNGFFDEPGWFGTWAALFLCADNLNLRKKENVVLLIGGVITLSLAFFMMLVIYYFLKNISYKRKWLIVAALVLIYIFLLPHIHTGIYSVDKVLSRMVITSNGLAGNNRYGSVFASLWQRTINDGRWLFGYGAGYAEIYGVAENQGLASIKSYIVNFGLFGTIIIFGPIFYASVKYALRSKNRVMLLYVIISYVSLYQRPYLFWTPYFIMFICGISYTKMMKINSIDNIRTYKRYEVFNYNSNI